MVVLWLSLKKTWAGGSEFSSSSSPLWQHIQSSKKVMKIHFFSSMSRFFWQHLQAAVVCSFWTNYKAEARGEGKEHGAQEVWHLRCSVCHICYRWNNLLIGLPSFWDKVLRNAFLQPSSIRGHKFYIISIDTEYSINLGPFWKVISPLLFIDLLFGMECSDATRENNCQVDGSPIKKKNKKNEFQSHAPIW